MSLPKIEWFFLCIFCKSLIVPVSYSSRLKTITVMTFHKHWWHDSISISAIAEYRFQPSQLCSYGQYYIAQFRNLYCDPDERKYLAISNTLNFTFVPLRAKVGIKNPMGYYHQKVAYSVVNNEQRYNTTVANRLIIYCQHAT